MKKKHEASWRIIELVLCPTSVKAATGASWAQLLQLGFCVVLRESLRAPSMRAQTSDCDVGALPRPHTNTEPSRKRKTQNTKEVLTAWLPDLHKHALPDRVQGLLWPHLSISIIIRSYFLPTKSCRWQFQTETARHRNHLIHDNFGLILWCWEDF